MRVVWLGTLALAVACLARPARAEPAAAPDVAGPNAGYQLSYDAPADCPSQAAFEAALKVRLPAAHASLAADAIRLHVELASPGAGRASALSVTTPDGSTVRREVQADSCFDVVQPMAVMAAMVLEESERAAASPEAAAEPPAPAPSAPPPEPRAAEPARPRAVATVSPARRDLAAHRLQGHLSAAGTLRSGVGPRVAPGVEAGLDLQWVAPAERATRVQLHGAYVPAAESHVGAASAELRLLAMRLTGCSELASASAVSLSPCAGVELGQLHGQGLSGQNARASNMPWLGLSLGLNLEARLGRSIALDLDAAAIGLAWHDRFKFDPDQLVYQVPVIVAYLAIGARFRAW